MIPGNGCQVGMLPLRVCNPSRRNHLGYQNHTPRPGRIDGLPVQTCRRCLVGGRRAAALNVATARQALADGACNTNAVLSVKNAEDAAKVQSVLTKPSSDSAMQYSQKAYEISADAAKELAKVFQDQFEQMNRSLRDLAQRTAHVGTTGIPGNMGPFNQVFEAANKAFENINEAVRQATENAQAMTRK